MPGRFNDRPRGIIEAYDEIFKLFNTDEKKFKFYEWILDSSTGLQQGQICTAVIWFIKRKKWYLEEAQYQAKNEEQSTWYARQLTHRLPKPEDSGFVKKYFDLGLDESFLVSNCKVRPVILLNELKDDWWNPGVESDHTESWLCLPIFSYKDRHNQDFVLNDQRLNCPGRFYIPPAYKTKPGIKKESAAIFNSMQNILTTNLTPVTHPCIEAERRSKPFKLSKEALKILLYHMYQSNNIFNEIDSKENTYTLFKEMMNDYIDSAKPQVPITLKS